MGTRVTEGAIPACPLRVRSLSDRDTVDPLEFDQRVFTRALPSHAVDRWRRYRED